MMISANGRYQQKGIFEHDKSHICQLGWHLPAGDEEFQFFLGVWRMQQHKRNGCCSPSCQAQLDTEPATEKRLLVVSCWELSCISWLLESFVHDSDTFPDNCQENASSKFSIRKTESWDFNSIALLCRECRQETWGQLVFQGLTF